MNNQNVNENTSSGSEFDQLNLIAKAVYDIGGGEIPVGIKVVSAEVGKSYQAVLKWVKAGHLPRTEGSGETRYAAKISELSGGKYKELDLKMTRAVA